MSNAIDADTTHRYWLVLEATGDCCGETIGCGVRIEQIDAHTMAGAREAAAGMLNKHEYMDADGRYYLDRAFIVTNAEEISIADLRAAYVAARMTRAAEKQEAKDRAEYERLKAKFG